MDLIYADVMDGMIIDRGVLHNFSFNLSFGEDENDFLLTLPMEYVKLTEDQVVYIPDTEYGGVIDSIEVDTTNYLINYSGRTWHGILENKILFPFKGADYFTVSGEGNDVLRQLLEKMNLIPGALNESELAPEHSVLSVANVDSGIWIDTKITSESGNYAHGYTFIRNLLYNEGAKLQIVDGVLSVVPNIDYANTDDFIVDTDQFKAKRQYNSLTRMHCMGQGDLRDRYTIDLYLDNNGGLLPYCRDNPVKDSDYYSDLEKLSQSTNPEDISNYNLIKDNVVPGINEISEIYDYPNAQTTYHYVLLTSKPADWDTDLNPELPISDQNKRYGFQNYFYQEYSEEKEATSYKQYERPNLDTRYDLQFSMPGDWLSNFANYYEQKANGYVKVSAVSAYDVVNTMPTGWYEGAYSNYYQLIGSSYQRVSLVSGQILTTSEPENWSTNWKQYTLANGDHVPSIVPQPYYKKLSTKPADWNSNYGNYYGQDGIGNYTHIAGVSKTKYKKQTKKPTDWATNYKRYYKKANNKYVAVQATSDKKAPKWEKGKYYTSYTVTSAPEFVPNLTYQLVQDPEHAPVWAPGTYYTSGKVVPTWGTITVYKKRTVPTWQTNKYYTAVTYQPIPQWVSNCAYTQYEDHYQALIEGALKKIEDYRKQDTLDVKLDEKQSYDINDIIGASDEVTGISVRERIVQKIIKIQRGVVSFEYRSGK